MTTPHLTVPGLDVSRETLDRLSYYADLLRKWTVKINLVAPSTLSTLWERHILDSAQLFNIAPPDWTRWTDIGSGGGLPGLVIAILDTQRRPITLIESDQRKSLFLNTVRRELDLNVAVISKRIEHTETNPADVLSARALAPLNVLLESAEKHLSADGKALFLKGERYQEELDQAAKNWHFDATAHPSQTHQNARILEVTRIKRREA